MARLIGKSDLALWLGKLAWAHDVMKSHHTVWRRMLAYYRNRYYPSSDLEMTVEHRARANYVFSTVRTIIPAVYFQNPYVLILPRRPGEDDEAAQTLEIAVNYYIRELALKRQIRLNTLDACLFGTGIIKIGYSIEFGEMTAMPSQDETMMTEMFNKAILAEGISAPDYRLMPHDRRSPYTLNEYVRQESPFFLRVSPFDFRVDPEAVTLAEAGWVAHRNIHSLKELRKNEYYQHTDRVTPSLSVREGETTEGVGSESRRYDRTTMREDIERVAVWEIWDKEEERVIWIADGYEEDALRTEAWGDLYVMEGFPFEVLQFEEDPERFWPLPLVAQIEDQVRAVNEITSKQLNHLRRFNRKYKVLESNWTTDILQTLRNPEDGALVKVRDMGAIEALQDAPLSPDVYNGLNEQKSELYEISGVTDYARGFSARSRTATEASILSQNQNLRVMEKVDLIEDYVGNIARKLIQVLKQYAPERQLVSITGRGGNRLWTWLSRESIQGEVDVMVEAGSAQAPNKEVIKKQALDLYNILRADPLANPTKLIHQLLESYDVKDTESYFISQETNPSELHHAQLENLVMSQGMAVEVLRENDHSAHLQIHQAFLQDPRWGTVLPQNQQLVMNHLTQHQTAIQESTSAGQPPGRPVNPALLSEKTPTFAKIAGGQQGV